MNRKHVHSSRVISIGWQKNRPEINQPDTNHGILEVEFKGGSVYHYSPVPESTYNNLLESYQIGVDMQAIIKDAGIVCTKQQ